MRGIVPLHCFYAIRSLWCYVVLLLCLLLFFVCLFILFVCFSTWKINKNSLKLKKNPILKIRQEQGEFHLLIKELWNYPNRFQASFRMSAVQFDALQAVLEPHFKKKTNNFHKLVDPEQRLAVCLR